MATHSSILAWKIPWTEDSGSPWHSKESGRTEHMSTCCTCLYTLTYFTPLTDKKAERLQLSISENKTQTQDCQTCRPMPFNSFLLNI